MTIPLPDDEAGRLAALYEHNLLDTPPTPEFDDLVCLAAQVCGTPIAGVSLVDADRQWFKSVLGMDTRETPRDSAFCAHTILQPDLMVIPDARADPRFADNPLVTGDPHIRFYAGVPLVTEEGHALGSLCVIDRVPKAFTDEQAQTLRLLARQASSQVRASRRAVEAERLLAEKERLLAERAEAERALLAEREFQGALLESLQEGIVACDAAGTLTLFNRATREFHGLPEQPLSADRWAEHFDLYGPDGLTPMRTEDIPLFRAFQGETVRGAEMVIAPQNGPRRTMMVNGQPIYGANGERLGAVAAMHDVTQRRRAEVENARFAAIVDSSQDAILAATVDGTLVSWNRGAERLYGRPAGHVIGRHFSALAPPGAENPSEAAFARACRGETVEAVEVERVRPDGAGVTLSLGFSPLRSVAGEVIGVVCIGHDITGRRAMEKALRESEARLHRLLDAAFEGIAVSQDGVLVEVSPAYAALFGYAGPAEMAGLAVASLTTPESLALVSRKIAENDEEPYEAVLQRRDGTTFPAEIRGRQAQLGGRPARMTAVRDITARRAMEQDLRENAERLRRSEAALRTLLESAPIILYAADADGTITLSEGTGLAALGLKPGEAVGRNLRDFQNSAESADYTRRALAGEAVSYDTQVGGIWLHVALQPVHGADGGPGGLIGVCFDVTERIASEERFRVLFERAPHPHLLFDEQGGIIDCNDATLALMRCADKAALLGVHPALLSPEFQPDGRPSAEKGAEMVALAWEQGGHRFEWRRRDMGGHEFPVEVTLTPVTLGGRPVLLSVWHDLTERKRAEREAEDYRVVLEFQKQELEKANAELAALATTDGLTGLRNHRALQERLADEVAHTERYGAPLSLLLLDVDHFKQYNDAFGHPAGDDVLRRVARLLEADIRNTDTAARYGGEEFVIILPQTDADGAHVIAERVRAAIEAAPWDGRSVTVSIGVCTFALTTHTPAAMLACADAALYRSKADGRNRVTHGAPAAPAMDSTPLPDMALASH